VSSPPSTVSTVKTGISTKGRRGRSRHRGPGGCPTRGDGAEAPRLHESPGGIGETPRLPDPTPTALGFLVLAVRVQVSDALRVRVRPVGVAS
jgi:hypothetical protein